MSSTSARGVYNYLKGEILSGGLQPGAHLREAEIAASLGCSRTPVREAIRQLDSEGLIVFEAHRGARVTSWSESEIEEVFRIRILLEGRAASVAANNIGIDELELLTSLAEQMEDEVASSSPTRYERIATLNNSFHSVIHTASREPMLVNVLKGTIQVSMVRNTFSLYQPAELQRSMGHHRELISALSYGDSEWAESVMRSHIRAARWVTKARSICGSSDDGGGGAKSK